MCVTFVSTSKDNKPKTYKMNVAYKLKLEEEINNLEKTASIILDIAAKDDANYTLLHTAECLKQAIYELNRSIRPERYNIAEEQDRLEKIKKAIVYCNNH